MEWKRPRAGKGLVEEVKDLDPNGERILCTRPPYPPPDELTEVPDEPFALPPPLSHQPLLAHQASWGVSLNHGSKSLDITCLICKK